MTAAYIGIDVDLEGSGPFEDNYISDRTNVWDMIETIIQCHEGWIYAKFVHKYRDGWKGYCELH